MPNTSPANTSPTLGTRANTVSPSPVDTLREKLEKLKTDFEKTLAADIRAKKQLEQIHPAREKGESYCYKATYLIQEGLKACQQTTLNQAAILANKQLSEAALDLVELIKEKLSKSSLPAWPQLHNQLQAIRAFIGSTNRPTDAEEGKTWDALLKTYAQLKKQIDPVNDLADTIAVTIQKFKDLQEAVNNRFPQGIATQNDPVESLKRMQKALKADLDKALTNNNLEEQLQPIYSIVDIGEHFCLNAVSAAKEGLKACQNTDPRHGKILDYQREAELALTIATHKKNELAKMQPPMLPQQLRNQLNAIRTFIKNTKHSTNPEINRAWNVRLEVYTQLQERVEPVEKLTEELETAKRQVTSLQTATAQLFPQNAAPVIVQSEPPTGVVPSHPNVRVLPQSSPSAATTKSTTTTRVASTLATASAPAQTRNPIAAPVAAPRVQVQHSSPVQRPATTSAQVRTNASGMEAALVAYYSEAADAVERHNEGVRRDIAEMKKRVDIDTANQVISPLLDMTSKLHDDFEIVKKTTIVSQFLNKNSTIADTLEIPFNKILEALREGLAACEEPRPNSALIIALQLSVSTEMSQLIDLKTKLLADPYPSSLRPLVKQLKDLEKLILSNTRPSTTLDAENWDLAINLFNTIRGQVLFKETVEENIQEITTNMNNFNARVTQLFPKSGVCHATQFNPTHPIQIPRVETRMHTVNSPVR